MTGEVVAINSRLKTIDVRDQNRARYIVEVDFADIYLPDRGKGKIGDIPIRSRVKVYGRLLPNRVVEGERIVVEGRESGWGSERDRWEYEGDSKGRVSISGTVASLDARKREIKVRTRQGMRTVTAGSRTRILAEGLSIELREIPLGSQVFVSGQPSGRDRIAAERIVVGESERESVRTLRGEIVRMRGREWVVRADDAETGVRLDDNTEITLDGRKASTEEVAVGDRVTVRGIMRNGQYVAQTIEVTPSELRPKADIEESTEPRKDETKGSDSEKAPETDKRPEAKQQSIEGTVVEVFTDDRSFRLRSGNRTITVDAATADILAGDQEKEFADIRENRKVRVSGWMHGDILEATQVEML